MINCKVFLKNLKDYISGELYYEDKKLSDEHIRSCDSCKKTYDEQLFIYNSLMGSTPIEQVPFSSSRNEILNQIDKTRYSKNFLNKVNFFFRRNSLRYAISSIALILLVFLAPYIYINFTGNSNIIFSNSKNVTENKLNIIKDIEYISLLQEGVARGAYLDKVIFANKDKELTEKIKSSIQSGKVVEDINDTSKKANPLIIGIKQKDGSYLEGEYIDGRIIFTKPLKITIITDANLDTIIQDFRSRKLITATQNLNFKGQVRNNKIIIERTKIYSFGEDSVFKNFKGSDKKPSDYEQSLIKEAVKIGIDENKLRAALEKAKQYKKNIKAQYPIIIDTGVYRDKACFIFTFTWNASNLNIEENKVQNLGHVFTVILDEDGNEIAYATSS